MNNYEEYNKAKLAEAYAKLFSNNFDRTDLLEAFMNFTIDNTVKNKEQREIAKANISSAKELLKKIVEEKN